MPLTPAPALLLSLLYRIMPIVLCIVPCFHHCALVFPNLRLFSISFFPIFNFHLCQTRRGFRFLLVSSPIKSFPFNCCALSSLPDFINYHCFDLPITYIRYYLISVFSLSFSNHLQPFKSRQNDRPRSCSQDFHAYVPLYHAPTPFYQANLLPAKFFLLRLIPYALIVPILLFEGKSHPTPHLKPTPESN